MNFFAIGVDRCSRVRAGREPVCLVRTVGRENVEFIPVGLSIGTHADEAEGVPVAQSSSIGVEENSAPGQTVRSRQQEKKGQSAEG